MTAESMPIVAANVCAAACLIFVFALACAQYHAEPEYLSFGGVLIEVIGVLVALWEFVAHSAIAKKQEELVSRAAQVLDVAGDEVSASDVARIIRGYVQHASQRARIETIVLSAIIVVLGTMLHGFGEVLGEHVFLIGDGASMEHGPNPHFEGQGPQQH